jgi:hypothetical protein
MTTIIHGEFSVTNNLQGTPVGDTRALMLKDLAAFCLGIVPTKVIGEPDWQDGRALVDDLKLIAEKVDRVIAAYGDYADSVIGISKEDQRLFVNQLSDALTGNAMHVIESSIEWRQECLDEDAGTEDNHEFRIA